MKISFNIWISQDDYYWLIRKGWVNKKNNLYFIRNEFKAKIKLKKVIETLFFSKVTIKINDIRFFIDIIKFIGLGGKLNLNDKRYKLLFMGR